MRFQKESLPWGVPPKHISVVGFFNDWGKGSLICELRRQGGDRGFFFYPFGEKINVFVFWDEVPHILPFFLRVVNIVGEHIYTTTLYTGVSVLEALYEFGVPLGIDFSS